MQEINDYDEARARWHGTAAEQRELADITDWVANGYDGFVQRTAATWNACDPEPENAPVAVTGRDMWYWSELGVAPEGSRTADWDARQDAYRRSGE
jgi:hypothetical protein